MLCPEVSRFPPPKVMTLSKTFDNFEKASETFRFNHFYRSLIITCPDELQPPRFIEDCVLEDSDYYKLCDCSLTEFIEPTFIEKFLKKGKLYCLSTGRNCIVENCAAVTPDGILTLHILEFIYQTLGLEGTKRPHGFYELNIDLKNLKIQRDKLRTSLSKLEKFDFCLSWEPNDEDVCPSSIAKYFYERGVQTTVHSLSSQKISPEINEIPSITDVEVDEMVEWIGMLAHGADLSPKETYISTYEQPESENALKSGRISLLIVKGFVTPSVVVNICKCLQEHVLARELNEYWASVSIQSDRNSLFQWNMSSPRMFQSHDSSCSMFFTKTNQLMYSIGQLLYS